SLLLFLLARSEGQARSAAERSAGYLRGALRERERMEGEREQLIAVLERSNRDLDEVAAVASHDLKAPLRGIATLASLLARDLDPILDDDGRQQLRLLRERVRQMSDLVDAILQYARAGRERSAPEPVDVGALVRDVGALLDLPEDLDLDLGQGLPVLMAQRLP